MRYSLILSQVIVVMDNDGSKICNSYVPMLQRLYSAYAIVSWRNSKTYYCKICAHERSLEGLRFWSVTMHTITISLSAFLSTSTSLYVSLWPLLQLPLLLLCFVVFRSGVLPLSGVSWDLVFSCIPSRTHRICDCLHLCKTLYPAIQL